MKWGNKLATYHTNLGKSLQLLESYIHSLKSYHTKTWQVYLFYGALSNGVDGFSLTCTQTLFYFSFCSFGKHCVCKSKASARARRAREWERARSTRKKINGGSVNRSFLNWFMSKVEKTVQGYIQFRYKNTLPSSFYHWAGHRNS